MKPADHMILGIHLQNRVRQAGAVQKLLTAHGCCIKTRIGLHDVHETYCAPNGIILLELAGDMKEAAALTRALKAIKGVDIKQMIFKHS
jgi:hypothetical protein